MCRLFCEADVSFNECQHFKWAGDDSNNLILLYLEDE